MNASESDGGPEKTQIVSNIVYLAIGSTFSILFILALAENVLVIIVYLSTKSLRKKMNFWIMAVVSCDLLIVINAFPLVTISSFAKKYMFGTSGCKWDGFIVTFLGTSSIFLLTGLSVHRYVVMTTCTPSKSIRKTTVLMAIMFCFALGMFWGVTPLIGWGSYALEGIQISCAPDWRSRTTSDVTYHVAMYILVLVVPLILMGFCYLSILYKVSVKHIASSKCFIL